MATLSDRETPATESEIKRVADLLGGSVVHEDWGSSLHVHEFLRHGLPGAALTHLIGKVALLGHPAICGLAIGMSLRTYQRFKAASEKTLSTEQSGRIWKFAEILAKATAILGSQDEAEQWLMRPAIGLDQRRPIDLLATPVGVGLVEDLLDRLEYGVYA